MLSKKNLYYFGYDDTEQALCQLESKHIFNKQAKGKVLFSDIKFEPSNSAFIKRRIDVISSSENYETLVDKIKQENINVEGFKIEYLVLDGDTTAYKSRLNKLRDFGYVIEGNPDYYHPTTTYGLCYYESCWYFGVLIKNNLSWRKHNEKPFSYSNSISINIAKTIVNIATAANKKTTLLDACCGAGTIMLEACFAGYSIEGCDINWKLCRDARANLAHFDYTANIIRSDIKDISKKYDAVIIDLPYNLLSCASDHDIQHIINAASKLSDRLVIISIADIEGLIQKAGFSILDCCSISKKGKISFARKVWVCEKGDKRSNL